MCGKLICWIFIYFLSFEFCFANNRYIYLSSRLEGQAITSHLIKSMQTYSEIGCSRNCLNNEGCMAISFGCRSMEANGWGICDLISEDGGTPYTVAVDPAMCTMAVVDRYPEGPWSNVNQPTISSVTTDAMTSVNFQQTTASTIRVVDMIDRLQNMCSASSQSDFAVITTEIIYFYDDKASLTSGSCKSVHYSTLFSGYSDLPDITHWKAVLTMSQSYVDVYTDTKVFRWGITSQSLHVMSGYPKFRAAYLRDIKGSPVSYIPTDPVWAVHRVTLGSWDIYFYESNNKNFNLYSNQPPGEWTFAKSDNTIFNQNGWALNPWTDLPPNTVALTAQDHTGIDFVGITGNFDVFFYKVTDQYQMLTDPIVTIHKLSF
ncbi:uncharacterized protein LOC128177796 [Crassostrea angulata]|uniref:uncharacterized protein LOC128177796 n=1 Tax=Magallana angulata TaxID=2784310 RepID=UPI0022B1CC0A|nr:uncharacterized protein LOC128177796 [Crassostrea angulata]